MTTQGAESPLGAGAVDDETAPDWDHPLTRLILLLEIADGPDWLREMKPPTRHAAARAPGSARQGPRQRPRVQHVEG
ncbi:hypothetical protein [Streptomyces sp. NPDC048172]|uniref:hypothetical protein n=1 Tax=Streptomyces sp. NPDC048172 TaxID=3365505 RepID=UPI00371F6447